MSAPTIEQIRGGAVRCWRCRRWSVDPDGTRVFASVTAPIPDGERLAGRLAYWCPDHDPVHHWRASTPRAKQGPE